MKSHIGVRPRCPAPGGAARRQADLARNQRPAAALAGWSSRTPRQLWVIRVPSTFRHSRMKAASPVQPLAETIVPST